MTDDSSLRILLVEDNPGDARYIRELLPDATELSKRALGRQRNRGALVEQSSRGGGGEPTLVHETRLAGGIEQLEEREPDVVLLDLNLPDSDGLNTLTTVRENAETIPIVVLTGLRDQETGIEALRRGADEYLVKDEINADLLVRTVYHAIERKAHERELKRYETLIEESTDVNAVIDPDGTLRYLTPSVEHVLGYPPGELIDENAFEYIHPEDREAARGEFADMLENPEYRPTFEIRFEHRDGSWVVLQARGRNLLDDPVMDGLVMYTHDITHRKEYERQLEQQREQLAALNQLNGVVHEITDAVIEQSTREAIEETVCEYLAGTESYAFAWIGEVDTNSDTISVRAEAGTEDYLNDVTISVDPEDERSSGPTGQAILTSEIQTAQDIPNDPRYEPWREQAEEYGFRSSAALPIVHEDTLYGVLNVYAERPYAFEDPERSVVGQLGEIVGHAIAAVERKRALTSDELVELEFQIRNVFEALDVPTGTDEEITIDQAVLVGDDEYLAYGTTTEEGLAALETLTERLDHWNDLNVHDENFGSVTFEVRLTDPPVLTAITASGGSLEEATFRDGDYRMRLHLPQGADVRQVTETVQEAYPSAEALARRQITSSGDAKQRIKEAWGEELTERQRAALEVAYYSGFFEWPRVSSGEEVADTLDISPATFSQHIRAAESKLFGALLDELPDTG